MVPRPPPDASRQLADPEPGRGTSYGARSGVQAASGGPLAEVVCGTAPTPPPTSSIDDHVGQRFGRCALLPGFHGYINKGEWYAMQYHW